MGRQNSRRRIVMGKNACLLTVGCNFAEFFRIIRAGDDGPLAGHGMKEMIAECPSLNSRYSRPADSSVMIKKARQVSLTGLFFAQKN
jgi:hypothetical protein